MKTSPDNSTTAVDSVDFKVEPALQLSVEQQRILYVYIHLMFDFLTCPAYPGNNMRSVHLNFNTTLLMAIYASLQVVPFTNHTSFILLNIYSKNDKVIISRFIFLSALSILNILLPPRSKSEVY